MSEIPLDPDGQMPQKGTGGGGIVIPDAVESLVAEVAELKTWRDGIEARLDALAVGTPQQQRPGASPIQRKPKKG